MFSKHAALNSGRGMWHIEGLQAIRRCAGVFVHEAVYSMPISLRHQIVQQGVDCSTEVEEHRGHQVEVLRQVVQKILRVHVRIIEGCVILCGGQVHWCHGLRVCVSSLITLFIRISMRFISRDGEAGISISVRAKFGFCDYFMGGLVILPKGLYYRTSSLRWVLGQSIVEVDKSVWTAVAKHM